MTNTTKKKFTKCFSNKYIFTLKNINPKNIEKRFGITLTSNINMTIEESPDNTTKISDLSTNKTTPEVISFIDEAKKHHKCTVSMIDFKSNKEISYDKVEYQCFWCRHDIPPNISAIGCPIKYVPSKAIKTYYSEISKDTYTIKEDVTHKRKIKIEDSDNTLIIGNKSYYITDGIFCSFNCCMAYISDNSANSLYNTSEMLLLKMYNNIYPDKVPSIEDAPHWRLLKQSGGHLTISQFRDSFSKVTYQPHGTVNIQYKSIGNIYEEKLRF
jgi:hypothetical protein